MAVSSKPDQYISALTGLRAIAAYLVFLHHDTPASPGTIAHHVFDQGYIGVTVFFVLSGFLIYHRYADAYFRQENWSWQRYLQNRFARIYPLYALLLLITVGVATWRGNPMSLSVFSLNITLLKGLFNAYKFSGIAQSWSLTVEICFYLMAPLLFLLLRRWGPLWLTVGLVSGGILLWTTIGQLAFYGLFSPLSFIFFYTFFGRGFEFVMGMWLAQRWHQNRLPGVPYPTLAGLIILLGCVGWQAGLSHFTIDPVQGIWSEILTYNILLPIGIGFFFTGLITQPSVAGRLLSHPLMQILGRSSYAFYLIHTGLLSNVLQKAGVTHSGLRFILLTVAAYLLYYLIESPLQRLLRAD
ncbi:acyltransferase family protein [Spirosoma spitsbergense]|uniref:acyltransferase family protein n=1 Tax=Spirosoma spitsbergense TaxID=431554 RepID=UPI0003676005|nr:acyltransferase [Spirosoma spitsbergense]